MTCHYVLNVMDEAERNEVIESILSLLNPKGKAYITVRRDIKSEGFTSRGTYQENVRLDLPIVKELKNAYCIYELTL